MSQCERILKYMETFGSITTMEAFNVLGVTRLSGRIHDLRQRGYDIESETIESENRYGDKVRYYKYFLKKDNNDVK
jgi:hypothetical protein